MGKDLIAEAGLNMLVDEEDIHDFFNPSENIAYSGDASANSFLRLVLSQAIKDDKATDIYLEAFPNKFAIREKVGGVIYELPPPPRRVFEHVRDEVLGLFGLMQETITPKSWRFGKQPERKFTRIPDQAQSQIFSTSINYYFGDIANLNLSILPTRDGEHMHIEVFDINKLRGISLDDRIASALNENTSGLFILSSPPDGGKTTTGYNMLEQVCRPDQVEIALEKKPAYPYSGISKLSLNPRERKSSETFELVEAYSPHVLFIDDITDQYTAREAIRHAKNGRLVIAGVCATNPEESVNRFLDLGGKPAEISDSLRGVISQRLVKQVHTNCEGVGCPSCQDSGYSGQVIASAIVQSEQIGRFREEILGGQLKRDSCLLTQELDRLVAEKRISEYSAQREKMII